MIRSLVTALVGFVAGWVLVPSLLSLKWELDGFTGSTSTLAVVGYVILCAPRPAGSRGGRALARPGVDRAGGSRDRCGHQRGDAGHLRVRRGRADPAVMAGSARPVCVGPG